MEAPFTPPPPRLPRRPCLLQPSPRPSLLLAPRVSPPPFAVSAPLLVATRLL